MHSQGLPDAITQMNLRTAELTQKVIETFRRFDKVGLIGGLNYNHFIKQCDAEDDGMTEVILEYGLSIAAALPETSQVLPHGDINGLITDLTEIKQLAHAKGTAESINNSTNAEPGGEIVHELQ